MEPFEEQENKKSYKTLLYVIGGAIIMAIIITGFLLFRKNKKETTFEKSTYQEEILKEGNSQEKTLNQNQIQPKFDQQGQLFSFDLMTWKNYFWAEKNLNLKYPGSFLLEEEEYKTQSQIQKEKLTGEKIKGEVVLIKLIPPTNDPNDIIFIGGKNVTCNNAKIYPKFACLKGKFEVPFYTKSQNQNVLAAFDLILSNSFIVSSLK